MSTGASSVNKLKRGSSPNTPTDSPTTTNRPVSPFKLPSPDPFYHRNNYESNYNNNNLASFNFESNAFMTPRNFDQILQNNFNDTSNFKNNWRHQNSYNYHQLSDHFSVFHPSFPSSSPPFSSSSTSFLDYKTSSLPILPHSNITSESGLFFPPFTASKSTFPSYSGYNLGYPTSLHPSSPTPSSIHSLVIFPPQSGPPFNPNYATTTPIKPYSEYSINLSSSLPPTSPCSSSSPFPPSSSCNQYSSSNLKPPSPNSYTLFKTEQPPSSWANRFQSL